MSAWQVGVTYTIQVSVASASTATANSAVVNVTVLSAGVNLVIVGGTANRQVGTLAPLTIDASGTVDLDRITTEAFAFTWTCGAADDNGT